MSHTVLGHCLMGNGLLKTDLTILCLNLIWEIKTWNIGISQNRLATAARR